MCSLNINELILYKDNCNASYRSVKQTDAFLEIEVLQINRVTG